jgi:integrase
MEITMEKTRLTNAILDKLPPPSDRPNYLVWDKEIPGFGIRVGSTTKTWLVTYRSRGEDAGKQRKLKLGTYPTINTDQARRLAKAALGEVASKNDPAAVRAEEKRREASRLSDLLDDYTKDRRRRKVIAVSQEDRALRLGFGPKRLTSDVAELDRRAMSDLIDRIARDRGEGAAGYFRKAARTFLDWCVDRGMLFANPLAGYRRAKQTRAEKLKAGDKARALPIEELRKVWKAADQGASFGRMVRFIMLAGCRRDEAASLEWRWIDWKARTITLPAALTKMGRDHIIPITPVLERVVRSCPRTTSPLVFYSEKTLDKIKGWSKLMPKVVKASGVEFTLHDLRRSLKTNVRELGYDADLAGLLVGHARDSFEARYDHSQLLNLRHEAAGRYAKLIEGGQKAIARTQSSKVVLLSS